MNEWSRRLTLFYKIINNLTPLYTKEPIPPLHQSSYSLCNQDAIGRMKARTEKFQSSFYPNCTSEWNKLDPEIRLAPSLAVFKTRLLSKIRPPAKPVFGIHDPTGLSYLFQIRVGLSRLNCQIQPNSSIILGTQLTLCVERMTVLRTRSTFCCFALHLTFNDDIFSLEFRYYYNNLLK